MSGSFSSGTRRPMRGVSVRIPRHVGPRFHVVPGRNSTASRATVPPQAGLVEVGEREAGRLLAAALAQGEPPATGSASLTKPAEHRKSCPRSLPDPHPARHCRYSANPAPATNSIEANGPSGAVLLFGPAHEAASDRLLLDSVGQPVSHPCMRSQLADAARRRLSDDVRRMSVEQRLAAFLAHCQLVAQLASAGGAVRTRLRGKGSRNAC